ncbi:hypothetical protein AALO_G00010950 [Alosa alosa]|uniref:Uncharacterized protein n=1 Tax=Alosa alosa TaxID=278164 RepID=A0AAV6HJJ0_9TELE|nr:hypothetical protein AALO_G00010950 [Alosa alosa]
MEMNMVAALCCVAVYFATICASTPPILNCCCTKVTETLRKIKHLQNLHNYTEEPQLCSPMAIIRFVTVKGKIISDHHVNQYRDRFYINYHPDSYIFKANHHINQYSYTVSANNSNNHDHFYCDKKESCVTHR